MESSSVIHTIADIQQKIKVEIIWSRYNDEIVTTLKNSCLNRLNKINDKLIDVNEHDVPGAYELPVLAKNLILRRQPDVIIALGAIIRGETAHFEIVANSCFTLLVLVVNKLWPTNNLWCFNRGKYGTSNL